MNAEYELETGHPPRRDAIHSNSGARKFNPQCFCQSNNSSFAGAVITCCLALACDVCRNGSDEDDRPTLLVELVRRLLHHLCSRELSRIICTKRIHCETTCYRFWVAFDERLVGTDTGRRYPTQTVSCYRDVELRVQPTSRRCAQSRQRSGQRLL